MFPNPSSLARVAGRHAAAAILAVLLLAPAAALAQQETTATASEEDELAALLSVLAEETAVATQTKMNADFVPGIVTVLEGEEMEALGARNVGEAIALVPGLQSNRDVYGLPLYFVRGVPFFDSAGGFKILVDGLTLSRENSGVSGSVLTMAIEQVDRIEVIRGPGSGVWGDFAFVGLINIITRKDRGELWLAAGNRGLATGGAAVQYDGAAVDVSGTVSGWRSRGADAPDPLPPPAFYIADREVESFIGTGEVHWRGFTLAAAAVERDFGRVNTSTRHFPSDEESWAVQAKHAWSFGPGRSVEAFAGLLDNDIRIMAISYDSRLWNAGVDVGWKLGDHALLFRGAYSVNTIEEGIFVPPGNRPNDVVTDIDQKIVSAVLQDSFDIGSALTITAGVRYDDQSDIGATVTPRAAAVWRIGGGHVLKAQYAEGFRAPTFQYVYVNEVVNPAVEFEEVETIDLGYIYRGQAFVARATVFHSRFSNLRIPPPPYRTGADAEASGVEAEWEQSFSQRLKLLANVAWVSPDDGRPTPAAPGADSVGYAEWLGNLALLGRLPGGILVGLHWDHVGERDAGRSDEDGYDLVNLTTTWSPAQLPKLSLRAGVRNLFDDRISSLYYFVGGVQRPAFTGRLYTIQASWKF